MSEHDIGVEDIHRLITDVSRELDLDANKAIEGLKKDRELWNRLNKVKGSSEELKECKGVSETDGMH